MTVNAMFYLMILFVLNACVFLWLCTRTHPIEIFCIAFMSGFFLRILWSEVVRKTDDGDRS